MASRIASFFRWVSECIPRTAHQKRMREIKSLLRELDAKLATHKFGTGFTKETEAKLKRLDYLVHGDGRDS